MKIQSNTDRQLINSCSCSLMTFQYKVQSAKQPPTVHKKDNNQAGRSSLSGKLFKNIQLKQKIEGNSLSHNQASLSVNPIIQNPLQEYRYLTNSNSHQLKNLVKDKRNLTLEISQKRKQEKRKNQELRISQKMGQIYTKSSENNNINNRENINIHDRMYYRSRQKTYDTTKSKESLSKSISAMNLQSSNISNFQTSNGVTYTYMSIPANANSYWHNQSMSRALYRNTQAYAHSYMPPSHPHSLYKPNPKDLQRSPSCQAYNINKNNNPNIGIQSQMNNIRQHQLKNDTQMQIQKEMQKLNEEKEKFEQYREQKQKQLLMKQLRLNLHQNGEQAQYYQQSEQHQEDTQPHCIDQYQQYQQQYYQYLHQKQLEQQSKLEYQQQQLCQQQDIEQQGKQLSQLLSSEQESDTKQLHIGRIRNGDQLDVKNVHQGVGTIVNIRTNSRENSNRNQAYYLSSNNSYNYSNNNTNSTNCAKFKTINTQERQQFRYIVEMESQSQCENNNQKGRICNNRKTCKNIHRGNTNNQKGTIQYVMKPISKKGGILIKRKSQNMKNSTQISYANIEDLEGYQNFKDFKKKNKVMIRSQKEVLTDQNKENNWDYYANQQSDCAKVTTYDDSHQLGFYGKPGVWKKRVKTTMGKMIETAESSFYQQIKKSTQPSTTNNNSKLITFSNPNTNTNININSRLRLHDGRYNEYNIHRSGHGHVTSHQIHTQGNSNSFIKIGDRNAINTFKQIIQRVNQDKFPNYENISVGNHQRPQQRQEGVNMKHNIKLNIENALQQQQPYMLRQIAYTSVSLNNNPLKMNHQNSSISKIEQNNSEGKQNKNLLSVPSICKIDQAQANPIQRQATSHLIGLPSNSNNIYFGNNNAFHNFQSNYMNRNNIDSIINTGKCLDTVNLDMDPHTSPYNVMNNRPPINTIKDINYATVCGFTSKDANMFEQANNKKQKQELVSIIKIHSQHEIQKKIDQNRKIQRNNRLNQTFPKKNDVSMHILNNPNRTLHLDNMNYSNILQLQTLRKIKTLKELDYKHAESSGGGTSEDHMSMVISLGSENGIEELRGLDQLARKSSILAKMAKTEHHVQ